MDALMLLAGQVLQAQAPEGEPERRRRGPQFWEVVGALERDIAEAWRIAARMLAGFVVLALLLVGAHSAMPAEQGLRADCLDCPRPAAQRPQPSFSPLSAATWSDSIGRYSEPLPIASALAR